MQSTKAEFPSTQKQHIMIMLGLAGESFEFKPMMAFQVNSLGQNILHSHESLLCFSCVLHLCGQCDGKMEVEYLHVSFETLLV